MFLYLHYFHIFWSSSPIPQFYNFHIPKLPYIFIPLSPSSPIQEFNNSLTPIFLNSTNPLMPLSLHSLFPFPLLHIHIFPYSQFPIIPYSLYFPFFFKFADFLVKVTVILEPYDMHFRVRFKIWPFSGQNWVKIPLAPRGVLAPVSAQNRVNWEGRGLPHSIFPLAILLFLLLRSPYKITEPYDVPFCVSFKICPFSSENRVNENSRKKRSSNHRTLIFLESG